MSILWLGIGALLLGVGCTPIDPAASTFPEQPEPTQVAGPPGGYVDPGYGYPQQAPQQAPEAADQPGYPQGYQGGDAPSTEGQAATDTAYGAAEPEPSATPDQPGYDMGDVTDPEIDATLDGYGSWQENDDYGRIWRPDAATVGVDFTPYETDGSWIWSDAGWNYNTDYNWGWLPFHYGRWGWFDGYWGWQPGYNWSAAAVEWRGGGGYTGWRPLGPQVRDHRHAETSNGRHLGELRDSQWRFSADKDFGHGHIRGHLFQNPAEGLRVTSATTRPTLRGNYAPVSSASLMRGRLASQSTRANSPTYTGVRPAGQQPQGFRPQGSRPAQTQPYRGSTPTWRPQQQQGYRPQQTYRPQQQQTYRPQQQQTYRPQQQQTYRPQYQAPARSYNNNSYRPQYSAPSRSYSAPSRSYSAPSRSYSAPSRSYSAPSQSHSSSGGGGRSSGGGGGGGGGHHR